MSVESTFSSLGRSRGNTDLAQDVLDSLTAEVAVLDRSGMIIAVNDAWLRFAAENAGALETTGVGVNYLDVCRSVEDDDSFLAEQACRGIEQVLDGSRDVFKLEYPCHSPGEKRWFLLNVTRMKTHESFAVASHLSITERKLTEQKLVEAERLTAIGEAMRGLSHEGRNALQRAQAGIELLRTHLEENADALDLLNRIGNAQHHLLNLYEEVRRYAAPVILRCEPYCLNALITEVCANFSSRFETTHLSHKSAGTEQTCEVDVLALKEVLRQVFENALATDTQSVQIEVSCIEGDLDGFPAITIVVSDNGPSISPEDRETVFEPFYTTKLRGTGLGLAICKRIVTAHHGNICFGSPRLGGASVYITLPVYQVPQGDVTSLDH